LIDKYEKWASNLDDRIRAINTLLEKGFKVWLRFIPLLPIKNYEKIYIEFIEYIKKKIDLSKIYSTFAGWLLYTKKDYNKILSKYPNLDILHTLELWNDDFYRENLIMRAKLYKIFKELDKKCKFCLENWNILE
jgi:DNA repair photolyase